MTTPKLAEDRKKSRLCMAANIPFLFWSDDDGAIT
jgi:hypothetical protein